MAGGRPVRARPGRRGRRPGGGGPFTEHQCLGDPHRPSRPPDRGVHLAHRHQRGRGLDHLRPVLHRPGPGEPDADPDPRRGRNVVGALGVAAAVSSHRATGPRRDRDDHGARRLRWGGGRPRPAPGRQRVEHLHGRPGLDAPPAAAPGRAGLSPAQLRRVSPRHLPHPRRQRPGGHLHLAVGRPAGLADLVVDAGHQQRDHPGRGDELRGAAQPDHRRRGRAAGVGRSADRGAGRAGRRPPLRLRPGQREPAPDRHRVPERGRDLPDAGQHRGSRSADGPGHLAGLRAPDHDDHVGHQSGRFQVRGPRHSVGQLLPRRRRAARVRAGLLRLPPE